MKKVFAASLLLSQMLFSLDLDYGKGKFDFDFSLTGGMSMGMKIDIDMITLKESHFSLSENIFMYGNLDYYHSKTLDNYSSYFAQAASTPPGMAILYPLQLTPTPIPLNYKMHGVDMNIGLGYDLIHQKDSYLSIGIGTGFSMPFIETTDMIKDASNSYKALVKSETKIMTYKVLPSIHGAYAFFPGLRVAGSLQYGYQYGSVKNSYIQGDGDISGTNLSTDVKIDYAPFLSTPTWKALYLTAGYRYNDWKTDNMDVQVFNPAFSLNLSQTLAMGFSSEFFYFGVGYTF